MPNTSSIMGNCILISPDLIKKKSAGPNLVDTMILMRILEEENTELTGQSTAHPSKEVGATLSKRDRTYLLKSGATAISVLAF